MARRQQRGQGPGRRDVVPATEGRLRGGDAAASASEAHSTGMGEGTVGAPVGQTPASWSGALPTEASERMEDRASALPLVASPQPGSSIFPSVHFLGSSGYPGPGIIQPGNQSASLLSAPGRSTDHYFFIGCPLLTHNCNHATLIETQSNPHRCPAISH